MTAMRIPRSTPWAVCFVAALCAAGAAALSAAGCNPECGQAQTITYDGGLTDAAGTVYQSSPITGPLLHFPAQRTYKLIHHLRSAPTEVDIGLSFQESAQPDAPVRLTPSAGNQTLYNVDVDKGTIDVTNDVCGEFFIYVTARTGEAPDGG